MSVPIPIGEPDVAFLLDLPGLARAYFHTLPPAASAVSDEPIAVTMAVCRRLVDLLIDVQPAFLGACADPGTPREACWRAREWPAYKARREPPGPECDTQVDRIIEILKAHRVPVFRAPGYEADDLFGVLVPRLRRLGLRVVMLSRDHDLWQLVRRQEVVAWSGNPAELAVDEADVVVRYGVRPELLPVATALAGDGEETPQIKGVGEKNAARIVLRHAPSHGAGRSSAALLDEILRKWSWESTARGQPSAVGRALRDSADVARLALRMVELREDRLPVVLDLAELRTGWGPDDARRVRALGEETGLAVLRGCTSMPKRPLDDALLRRWCELEAGGT